MPINTLILLQQTFNLQFTHMHTGAIPNSPLISPITTLSSSSAHLPADSSSSAFMFHPQNPLSPTGGLVANGPPASCSANSNSLFKRRNLAKLAISAAAFSFSGMEAAVDDPWKEVVAEGDGYSVYCKRGKRQVMEDLFKAVVHDHFNQPPPKLQAFFGVFDGHGGSKAADFAAENLDKYILKEVEKGIEITETIRRGYMSTDSDFLNQGHHGGSCCVTAIIKDNHLVVSNAGDCRAVVSIGGTAKSLTSDHRPSRQDEKLRIESLGGYVDCSHGVSRVNGSLGVSRAIGDRSLKKWITAEPESKVVKIGTEFEFLIMASDGLWDKVSNQEAIDLARSFCVGSEKLDPVSACKKLVELSASRGSIDDTSVMIVQLDRYR